MINCEEEQSTVELNVKKLDLYDNKFIVVECQTEDIEMFQVKMFYYQEVPGLYPFRFSMSQHKSYMYYKYNHGLSFQEVVNQGITIKDFLLILEQLKTIIERSRSYLLYEENIQLSPEKIRIVRDQKSVKVECMYIPLKRKNYKLHNEESLCLVDRIAKTFSELDYLEGYYYFTRVHQDMKENRDHLGLYKHLNYFLTNNN
jgi:hypothetical protein